MDPATSIYPCLLYLGLVGLCSITEDTACAEIVFGSWFACPLGTAGHCCSLANILELNLPSFKLLEEAVLSSTLCKEVQLLVALHLHSCRAVYAYLQKWVP